MNSVQKPGHIWALEQLELLVSDLGSLSKAAKQVGINAGILSPLRQGTYRGNSEDQLDRLESYFRTKTEAAALASVAASPLQSYVPTSTSTGVYDLIKNCQLQGGLALAYGDAGVGKTKAAKQFVKDHPNDAIYVALNPCLKTIKAVLKILCRRVNVTDRTIDDMWLGLASKLRDGMVIIVDEAQHLPIKSIEALRALPDDFLDRGLTLGITFIGNLDTINRFGGRRQAEFAQISNRTRQSRLFSADMATREDVEILFPALATDEMSLELMLAIVHSAQAVRGAVNLYNNALDNANTSYDGLLAMAKAMQMTLV